MGRHAYDNGPVLRRIGTDGRPTAFRIRAAVGDALSNFCNGSFGEIVAHVLSKTLGAAPAPVPGKAESIIKSIA